MTPDLVAVGAQLQREPRGVRRVAHRCSCGLPDVIETQPRLPDGTPFPTLYYLTCPRASGAVGRLEAEGEMRRLEESLAEPDIAAHYAQAHDNYLAARNAIANVPEIDGISAGGMPHRVKCLHVLVAHSLAAGPGVNPIGDAALALLPDWGRAGCCVDVSATTVSPEEHR